MIYQDFSVGVIKFAQRQAENVANIVLDLKQETLKFLISVIDPESPGKLSLNLKNTFNVAIDKLSKASSKVSNVIGIIKRKIWEHKTLITDFMAVVRRSLKELSYLLHQFKAGKELVRFYYDYQSWFEEFHLSQQIQNSYMEIHG